MPETIDDPRDQITQHAFRVAPELLGWRLASPWRRGLALLADGVAVAILTNAPGLIFGIAVATVALRASLKPARGGVIRRSTRFATRAVTAVIVFAVAASLWETVSGLGDDDEEDSTPLLAVGSDSAVELTGVQGAVMAGRILAVVRADDEAEARDNVSRLVDRLREADMGDDQIREILVDVRPDGGERPWVGTAIDSVVAGLDVRLAAGERRDSLLARTAEEALAAYATAVTAGDSARAADLRGTLPLTLARDTIDALRGAVAREESRVVRLAEELSDERERGGIVDAFLAFADDLGLGFGWTSLYFTAFTVLWRGQTPGKKLFRTRVIRLDAVPLGWWASFGRFGGYAAGFATGLLGFLQIFWDPNRQAIQDKISGTVVVEDRGRGQGSAVGGR